VHTTGALPYLSAYLGHVGLKNSQCYLRLTADLHPDISSRMDEMFGVEPEGRESGVAQP